VPKVLVWTLDPLGVALSPLMFLPHIESPPRDPLLEINTVLTAHDPSIGFLNKCSFNL
jgi:hypothetical protein